MSGRSVAPALPDARFLRKPVAASREQMPTAARIPDNVGRMIGNDDALAAWDERLHMAEEELREREQRALADDPSPGEMLALAAERDKLAIDRDTVAEVYDDRAATRDHAGLGRDVGGSSRDRRARSLAQDRDPAFIDRFAAGEDRDDAAGDRFESFDDRKRSQQARKRAAEDRDHAAEDRERAGEEAAEQRREVVGLRAALESRFVIGLAEGLLMERHNLTGEAAFGVLVRISQETNRKLRDVAAEVVAAAEAARK